MILKSTYMHLEAAPSPAGLWGNLLPDEYVVHQSNLLFEVIKFHEEVTVLGLALSLKKRTASVVAVFLVVPLLVTLAALRLFWRCNSTWTHLIKHLHELKLVVIEFLKGTLEREQLALAAPFKLHGQGKLERWTGVLSYSLPLLLSGLGCVWQLIGCRLHDCLAGHSFLYILFCK